MQISTRLLMTKVAGWLLAGLAGCLLTLVTVLLGLLENREGLEIWHEVDLEEEFTVRSFVENYDQYLALEDRLFEELKAKVYDQTGPAGKDITNRFKRGSLADPGQWPRNWNRTFELGSADSSRAVLLLHGMSDSPYSLRSIGEALAIRGAHVIGLRVPGHGTAPTGLVHVRADDMRKAVKLAMRHLAEQNPAAHLQLIGYSNGAALALDYTLDAITDSKLPKPGSLVLLSPAIQITNLAAYAVWQARIGEFLGMEKLAWTDISLEYDPYKYNSFAVNAGDVTFRITRDLRTKLLQLDQQQLLGQMPPILTFLSTVDATVSATAVVTGLYEFLEGPGHELVVFDVNRGAEEINLLHADPILKVEELAHQTERRYTLSVITNRNEKKGKVAWRQWAPGNPTPTQRATALSWPAEVYSLSHVALPFPASDPVYGGSPISDSHQTIHLGSLAARGENGVLRVPAEAMLRQRWNPFHAWMLERSLSHPD